MAATVFGGVGTDAEDAAIDGTEGIVVSPLPLPGEAAPNFEVDAVVGEDITTVRLSDFNDQWRLVCFFPAAFTFV